MRIHPEMRDVMNAEMTKGLRLYGKKSPEEIAAGVRAEMLRDQAALLNTQALSGKEYKLMATQCRTECACPRSMFVAPRWHTPWCDGKTYIMFTQVKITPEDSAEDRRKRAFKNWMKDNG